MLTITLPFNRNERMRSRRDRFLMQAALDIPMTVYGTGGQTRGFIHVTDTAKCLEAAVVNPPAANGPVEIFNQARKTEPCGAFRATTVFTTTRPPLKTPT